MGNRDILEIITHISPVETYIVTSHDEAVLMRGHNIHVCFCSETEKVISKLFFVGLYYDKAVIIVVGYV